MVVLGASILLNWMFATQIEHATEFGKRRLLLQVALALNVSLLLLYKIVPALTGEYPSLRNSLAMPLGLSFFTLTQVMYLVDCYERLVPARSLTHHAAFVSFFPSITAGPIQRSRWFARESESASQPLANGQVGHGMLLIAMGMTKKIVVGDSFAKLSRAGYTDLSALSTAEAWVTVLASTFEIYFDFSGYSDIAIGSGLLLGFRVPRNFDVPFRSASISEFWKRWHMTLSDFITTYLYTPLLRRMGKLSVEKAAIASVIAMLIAGLWHGLSLNYAIFGLAHGLALGAYQFWKRLKRPLPRPADIFLTFLFVSLVFTTAKATSVSDSLALTARLFEFRGAEISHLLGQIPVAELRLLAAPVLVGSVLAFWGKSSEQWAASFPPGLTRDLMVVVLLVTAHAFLDGAAAADFRYRQF